MVPTGLVPRARGGGVRRGIGILRYLRCWRWDEWCRSRRRGLRCWRWECQSVLCMVNGSWVEEVEGPNAVQMDEK